MTSNILYVVGSLEIGGTERHLCQILPQLKNIGYEISIHTLSSKGALAPQLEAAGINVKAPPFADKIRKLPKILNKPLLLIFASISLIIKILKNKPDVIHFFLPEAYLVGGIASYCVPNTKRIMSRRSLNAYQSRYPSLAQIEKWLHSRMNAVLGNSQAVCQDLIKEGVTTRQIGLIYNGLELSPFSTSFSPTEFRHQLDIEQDCLVMSIVANLIPYKGHSDLLNALASIKNSLPENWLTVCIGRDAGILSSLQREAKELGIEENVLWLGSRSDIPDLLRMSDIGILCSHEEGFSNAILEGMAANLPMVVTDVGGNKEAVADGVTGFVVPAREPELLSKALLKLALDPEKRTTMGNAGRLRIEQHFSLSSCAKQYSNLYHNLINHEQLQTSQMIERSEQ